MGGSNCLSTNSKKLFMKEQISQKAIQRRGEHKGGKRKKERKGEMKRQPIDLEFDTKGLTSNAATNPFPQFYWPFRTPHFKGKDLNSETSGSLCSLALQPLVPVWTALQGEAEIKTPLHSATCPQSWPLACLMKSALL